MAQLFDLRAYRRRRRRRAAVYFSRRELNLLLGLFTRRVLAGEWRDYSIDNHETFAAFCVYRRAYDAPLYKVLKLAPGSAGGGDWALIRGESKIRQGRSLDEVLSGFAPSLRAVRS
ncbi:MAG TPA: DUF2794 domain-containing protein [Kiloniellales bacterium]